MHDKKPELPRKSLKVLTHDELESVTGGVKDAAIFVALSSTISEVLKNFGGALQTAARGG